MQENDAGSMPLEVLKQALREESIVFDARLLAQDADYYELKQRELTEVRAHTEHVARDQAAQSPDEKFLTVLSWLKVRGYRLRHLGALCPFSGYPYIAARLDRTFPSGHLATVTVSLYDAREKVRLQFSPATSYGVESMRGALADLQALARELGLAPP